MTPLQLQLYTDVLAKDWDRVNAMGESCCRCCCPDLKALRVSLSQ
jgi:hypothetical protein